MEQITITDRSELYGLKAKYRDYNLFVEAGAGAGKTETIINMIVSRLLSGVSPEKIVAITFTNKATEELISRITLIISEKIENKAGILSSSEIAILQNALNNIYRMNVSTIHHFCNVILNENSYKAELSFNSVLLEEDDENKRRTRFYYKWLHSLNKAQLDKIGSSDPDAFKNLKKTYDALCGQFDDITVNADIVFDYAGFFNKIFELYRLLQRYIGTAELGSWAQKFYDAFAGIYASFGKKSIEELFNDCESRDVFKTIRSDIKLKQNKKFPLLKEQIQEINENELAPVAAECVTLKDLAKEYSKDKPYETINSYAVDAWNAYKSARDRASLCNNQLIYETYKLLRGHPDVKEKLANQYDIIFVDEFQDTDKYQNKFIMDLALAIDGRKAKEGKFSTSVVLVGDPKQSIYGFRGADFKLFMEARNGFSTSGLHNAINVFLPDNYRSNNLVLSWINDTYRAKTFYSGYAYTDMTLPKSNKLPATLDFDVLAGVYSYNFNGNPDKFAEYAALVKNIKENKRIYSKSGINTVLQPKQIKFSDFLILTTSHTEINKFILAFNKVGIRTLVAGEFNLSSSLALGYIYRILKYLLDKENNIRALLEKDFNADIYDEAKLSTIKDDTKNYSPYGKLLYVISNIDLILEKFSDSDKSLLKTVLRQILDNVSYDSNSSATELMNAVDQLIHETQEAELSLEPNEDAVRIMNVHKAKGLTSEIVIVADSGGFKNDDSCKVLGDTIYLNNLDLYPAEKETYFAGKQGEKLRLEYVAATRARQAVIFESKIGDKQLFNRSEEQYNLVELEKYHNETELSGTENDAIDEAALASKIISTGISKADTCLSIPGCIELSPSSLEKSGCSVVPTVKYNRPANNIFGTAFHRVMELIVLNNGSDIGYCIDRAVSENEADIPSADIGEYKKYLKECADAAWALFADEKIFDTYKQLAPEYKFCDYDESLYGDKPALMTGSMDLLLRSDNGILIIDYKTDTNHFESISEFEANLITKYNDQLGTYKKVIGKLDNISDDHIESKIVWFEEKDGKTTAHFVSV